MADKQRQLNSTTTRTRSTIRKNTKHRTITGIDKANGSLDKGPSACVLVKKKFDTLRLSKFLDADQVAVLIKYFNGKKVVFASCPRSQCDLGQLK